MCSIRLKSATRAYSVPLVTIHVMTLLLLFAPNAPISNNIMLSSGFTVHHLWPCVRALVSFQLDGCV